MKKFYQCLGLAAFILGGCSQPQQPAGKQLLLTPLADIVVSPEQEAEIKALVEQLVFADQPAENRPVLNPHMKAYDADGKEGKSIVKTDNLEEYQKRFDACQQAFQKLSDFKILAFPELIAHLDDKRQSINFRNHYLGNSVGDACYWNIYYQLQDRPENYSSYGLSRTGRDGQQHDKPYWGGTPFDEAGGLKEWLQQNRILSYVEMQIRCLQWLLDKEKEIGACDADSFFENILPLEIRILERKLESGQDVKKELDKQKDILAKKDARSVPADLLPVRGTTNPGVRLQ
jgi:hypothetical protein